MYERRKTNIPDIDIRIYEQKKRTEENYNKNKVTLIAQAFSSSEPVSRKYRRTVNKNIADMNHEKQVLVNIVEKTLQKKRQESAKKNLPINSSLFEDAFCQVKKIQNINANWNEETTRNTLTYFERNILLFLREHEDDISDVTLLELKNQLVDKAIENGKSSKNRNQVENSVSSYLHRANYIFKLMEEIQPALPHLRFETKKQTSSSQTEQAKYIPDSVRVRLADYILHRVENGLSLGIAAMLLLGVRTAEACAIVIKDIISLSDCAVTIPILFQIKNNHRSDQLKTKSAYRHVIGNQLMYDLVTSRKHYLQNKGYSQEEINEMPLVGNPKNPKAFVQPSDLSAYAKNALLCCGYEKRGFSEAATLLCQEKNTEENMTTETDVTAYILRRDFISRAITVCGMAPEDVDYLVGHKNNDVSKKDYTNPDIQKELANHLERYVFLPLHSRHPYFAPLYPTSKLLDLNDFSAYQICAKDKPIQIQVEIASDESGETISLETNGKIVKYPRVLQGQKDSPSHRTGRPLLASVKPESYYNALIENTKAQNKSLSNEKEDSS
jgi:integrase